MASNKLYEPAARYCHVSFSVKEHIYLWGGVTQDLASGSKTKMIKLANCIERFDPYLEEWSQLNTTGIPHPGLDYAACASGGGGEHMYVYGGFKNGLEGVLSCLNMKTLSWSQLCPGGTAWGPMRKAGCGMVNFHHDKLAIIGGYGIPTGPTQPGSTFIRDIRTADWRSRGWTNEIHVFDLNQGFWLSPTVRGTGPPPCSGFTLTRINNHIAVLFGGYQPEHGQISDLYMSLVDFNTMEIAKVEPHKDEPWPTGRNLYAACCLEYAEDHILLLVTGGIDRNGKVLKDIWLYDLSLKKWKEVTLPDGTLSRWRHSTSAITLCPGLVEVVVFGGTPDDLKLKRPAKDDARIAETTIITFSQVGSKWELVGMVNNSQRGTSERIREKMLKISEKARAAIDNRAERQPEETSQANSRALQGRVEEAEAAVREERARARDAENRAGLAERAVMEQEQRAQEAERRLQNAEERSQILDVTLAEERKRAQEYERRAEEAEVQSREERHRADMADQRVREIRQELAASQERERQIVVRTTVVERHLYETEQRARESERRRRQAEALVLQTQQESHWLVQRREIELTEEERGRGGWAAVKVANFRGTRVAAKCFYQQILVSRYNHQLFN